jgi:hypothetical protein
MPSFRLATLPLPPITSPRLPVVGPLLVVADDEVVEGDSKSPASAREVDG